MMQIVFQKRIVRKCISKSIFCIILENVCFIQNGCFICVLFKIGVQICVLHVFFKRYSNTNFLTVFLTEVCSEKEKNCFQSVISKRVF